MRLVTCRWTVLVVVFCSVAGHSVAQQTFQETILAAESLVNDCSQLADQDKSFQSVTADLRRSQESLEACTKAGCAAAEIGELTAATDHLRRRALLEEVRLSALSSRFYEYVDVIEAPSSPELDFFLGEQLPFASRDTHYFDSVSSSFPTNAGRWESFKEIRARKHGQNEMLRLIVDPQGGYGYDEFEYSIRGAVGEICQTTKASGKLFSFDKLVPASEFIKVGLHTEFAIAIEPTATTSNIDLGHIVIPVITDFFSPVPHTQEATTKAFRECFTWEGSEANYVGATTLFEAIGSLRSNLAEIVGSDAWPSAEQLWAASAVSFRMIEQLPDNYSRDREPTAALKLSLRHRDTWFGDIELTREADQSGYHDPSGYRVGVVSIRNRSGLILGCDTPLRYSW